jgi:glycosyltransferase involved in cell wall biosynthesis
MAAPAISVILPVFDGEPYLDRAIDSILAQTDGDFELLIVDDGSADSSSDTIARFAAADDRIRPITFAANVGIIGALNHALDVAAAPLVARMDSDDVALPHRFAAQRRAIEARGDVALAGGFFHIDAGGALTGQDFLPPEEVAVDLDRIPYKDPYLPHPFLMARTEAMRRLGGYRHVFHAEDADLFWRLMDLGTISNLRDYVGYYRVHTGAISGRGVTNGRIQALYSQLAGLSAARRRQGRADIPFTADRIPLIARRAYSLESVIAAAETVFALDPAEMSDLTVRVVAKFLEFTKWRPFEVGIEDADYVGEVVRGYLGRARRGASRAYVKALWLDAYRRVRRTSRLVADPLIGGGTLRALAELRAGRA